MASTDLDALPAGSVIAADGVAAIRNHDGAASWSLTSGDGALDSAYLLDVSDDWTVLRRGPAVADEHTGPDPEVRHYIADVDDMRAHMTLTGNDDGGRIVTDRHPWEPLTDANGVVWCRVSAAVADQYDSDDEDRPEIDPVDLDSHAADARRIVGPEPR